MRCTRLASLTQLSMCPAACGTPELKLSMQQSLCQPRFAVHHCTVRDTAARVPQYAASRDGEGLLTCSPCWGATQRIVCCSAAQGASSCLRRCWSTVRYRVDLLRRHPLHSSAVCRIPSVHCKQCCSFSLSALRSLMRCWVQQRVMGLGDRDTSRAPLRNGALLWEIGKAAGGGLLRLAQKDRRRKTSGRRQY